MTIFRTLTATALWAAATLVVLSLSSCSSKEGTPVAAQRAVRTRQCPHNQLASGHLFAQAPASPSVTGMSVSSPRFYPHPTTLSGLAPRQLLREQERSPPTCRTRAGKWSRSALRSQTTTGRMTVHDSNVGLVESTARCSRRKESTFRRVTGTPAYEPVRNAVTEDFNQAKWLWTAGETVKCVGGRTTILAASFARCGVPEGCEGDKLAVTLTRE